MAQPRSRASVLGSNNQLPGAISPPATVTELISDTSDTNLTIVANPTAPGGQVLLRVIDADQVTTRFQVPQTGGPQWFGVRVGANGGFGYASALLDGTQNPVCLNLADGLPPSAAQGINVWGGTGAPSSTTVGSANVGDEYFRKDVANSGLVGGADTGLPLSALAILTLQASTAAWGTTGTGAVFASDGTHIFSWTGNVGSTLTGCTYLGNNAATVVTGAYVAGNPRSYYCTVAGGPGTWTPYA